MNLEKLLRKNIFDLQAYSCARDEYKGDTATFLDANENPFETGYNRYPDPYHLKIKEQLKSIKNISPDQIILGNGSDEIIDIIIRSFCEPKEDNILVFSPGYGMYEVSAAINDIAIKKVNLCKNFIPDWDKMWEIIDKNTKIIFLCTPNNPTGKAIPYSDLEEVAKRFNGIVLIDEAYIDFSSEETAVNLLNNHNNILVLQTLSKAWGMAGLRLGMCFGSPEIISVLNKVKAPYNIGSLTQRTVSKLLNEYDDFQIKCNTIISEKEKLILNLRSLNLFTEVYDSDANFVLVRCKNSEESKKIYNYLVSKKIVVRLRDIAPIITGCIRISVGRKEENDELITALEKL